MLVVELNSYPVFDVFLGFLLELSHFDVHIEYLALAFLFAVLLSELLNQYLVAEVTEAQSEMGLELFSAVGTYIHVL